MLRVEQRSEGTHQGRHHQQQVVGGAAHLSRGEGLGKYVYTQTTASYEELRFILL